MVGKLVRYEATQQLLSDLVWKLHNRVKPSSLTYVIQQVESRKAHKTLRSAERMPTLSAVYERLIVHRGYPWRVFIPQGDRFESHSLLRIAISD